MSAYDASEWTDFFVAGAGASAALVGLVFVAVSINVDRILRLRGLPERAVATVMLLLSAVLVSLLGLMPGQSRAALAGELLGVGLVFAVVILALTSRSMATSDRQPVHVFSHWFLVGLGTVPVVLGAVSLFAEAGGGPTGWRPGSCSRRRARWPTHECCSWRSCASGRAEADCCHWLLISGQSNRYVVGDVPDRPGTPPYRGNDRLFGSRGGPTAFVRLPPAGTGASRLGLRCRRSPPSSDHCGCR
jgi:hypothetical protein